MSLHCTGSSPTYDMTPGLCYTGLSSLSLLTLCSFILFCCLLCNFCRLHERRNSQSRIKLNNKIYTLAIAFFVSLCLSTSLQLFTLMKYGEFYVSDNPHRQILYLQYVFEVLFNILGYLYILMRLYLALKGSQFELKTCFLSLHISIICSIIIFNMLRIILYIKSFYTFARSVGSISIFVGFMGLLHIVFTFDRNLYLFIVHIHGQKSTLNINMNDRNYSRMFKVITKVSVLMTNMMVFAVIRAIFGFIATKYGTIVWFIACHTFYLCSMMLCVYLSMSSNERLYDIFCKFCDNKCIKICKKLAFSNAWRRVKMRQNIKYIAKHMADHVQSTTKTSPTEILESTVTSPTHTTTNTTTITASSNSTAQTTMELPVETNVTSDDLNGYHHHGKHGGNHMITPLSTMTAMCNQSTSVEIRYLETDHELNEDEKKEDENKDETVRRTVEDSVFEMKAIDRWQSTAL